MSPTFLIPIDNKFFLLGLCLIHTFKKFGMDTDYILVLDFGLLPNQIVLLVELGVRVQKTPNDLVGLHPFTLKSKLPSFLKDAQLEKQYLVLMDADMLLTKNIEEDLAKMIQEMKIDHFNIALSQDMGTNKSIGEFIGSYQNKLKNFIHFVPQSCYSSKYLNIGFTIFSPNFDFVKFEKLTDQMHGEMCWEQNAINLICLENPDQVKILDSKIWNFHGDHLLSSFSEVSTPSIIHLTSNTQSIVHGKLNLALENYQSEHYFRFFNNEAIISLQKKTLGELGTEYREQLLKYLAN